MSQLKIVSKESHHVLQDNVSGNVTLSEASVVIVKANAEDIQQIKRDGNNAVITLKSGEQIVIVNFFPNGNDNTENSLVFEDDQHQLKWVQFVDANGASLDSITLTNLESIEPLLYSDNSISPWAWLAIPAVAAGIAIAAHDDKDSTPTKDTTAPDAPVVNPPNGHDPITGKAEAGSEVKVTYPDGSEKTVTVDSDGNWTVPNPGLKDGDVIKVTATDKAGNTSPETTATVDAKAPDAPIVNPPNGHDPITGKAEAGSEVKVTYPDGSDKTVTVDSDGNWTVPNPGLKDGDVIKATATDKVGNTSPETTATVDAKAPDAPVVNPPNGTDDLTGTAEPDSKITVKFPDGSEGTTTTDPDGNWTVPNPGLKDGDEVKVTATDKVGNTSPETTATVDAKAPDAPLVNPPNGTDDLTGTAEPDSKITVKFPDGSEGTTTTDPDGNWSLPNPGLKDGDEIKVTATDKVGNTSPETTATVDAKAPDAPVVNPPNGTDDLTGTAEPDSKITVKFPDGSEGTTTTDPDGNWTVPNPGLKDGDEVKVTATDKVGNTSPETTATVDAKAPDAPTFFVVDDVEAVTGILVSGSSTNDTKPTFNGSGAEANAIITLKDSNGNVLGTTKADAAGNWSLDPTLPLAEGPHSLFVTQTDAVGNESAPSPFDLIIDTTAPATPSAPIDYEDNVGAVQSPNSTAPVTDDKTPGINVGKNLSDTPKLYVDGALVDSVYDKTTGTLTPTADIADGDHNFSYSLTDAAGNESAQSPALPIKIDSSVPATPAAPIDYEDNAGAIQSPNSTAPVTDDKTPGINVGKNLTDTPKLYVDGALVDSVYDKTTGTLTPTADMADGDHNFSYTLTNAAGNESAQSPALPIKIDSSVPATPSAPIDYEDNVGAIQSPNSTAPVTDDKTPGINVGKNLTDTPKLYVDGVLVDSVYDKTTGTLTPTVDMADGDHNFSYTLTNAVGNESAQSPALPIKIDSSVPATPSAPIDYEDNVGAIQSPNSTAPITDDKTPGINVGKNLTDTPKLYVDGALVDSVYDKTTGTLTPTADIADGDHNFSYTLTNAAGNESAQSPALPIKIDSSVPATPSAPIDYEDNVGAIQSPNSTAPITDDKTPGINVGKNLTDTPKLYVDGALVDSVYDKTKGTLTPTADMADGDYNFSYTLTNAVGNESAQSPPLAITIDTIPPNTTGLTTTMSISNDTANGVVPSGKTTTITATNNDLITRDGTPTEISGTLNRALDAGEKIQISRDNGLTWLDVTSMTGLKWTLTLTDTYTVDTTLNFKFRVIDASANSANMVGQDKVVTIDLTAPDVVALAPNAPASTNITQQFTFDHTVYGLLEAGTVIALVNDVNKNGMWQEGIDQIIGQAIVAADGTWKITTTLPAGDLKIGFMQWDVAGNTSHLSPTTSVGVGTTTGGSEVITPGWGGTTDTEGFGLNSAAYALDGTGNWAFFQSVRGTTGINTANAGRVYTVTGDTYTSTYLAQPSNVSDGGYGRFLTSSTFVDINNDGRMDIISQVSSYGNGGNVPFWIANPDGTYTANTVNLGTLNHIGAVVAYDQQGDGLIDFVFGDSASDSISFVDNNGGTLSAPINSSISGMPVSSVQTISNGLGTGSVTGIKIPTNMNILHDLSGVDIDNNGTIDLITSSSINGTTWIGDGSRGLAMFYNSGTSAGFTYVNKSNILLANGGTDYPNLLMSMTYADFNGDGWLDLYINRGTKAGADSNESRIYLNDGKGQLLLTDAQALWFGDSDAGGTSFAVDWNFDGKMDVIELPLQATGGATAAMTFNPKLYLNQGNDVWSGGTALATGSFTNVTGAALVDYDWDGAQDIMLYRAGADAAVVSTDNAAPTSIIRNTNVVAEGTSMNIRILSGMGINSYYGNTVKLYDSAGNLVSTQILNPQSAGANNSTGLLSFYGLKATETYSVQMLRITNGVSDNISGVGNLGGYNNATINSNWSGLKTGKANEAFILTAESDTAVNNSVSTASGIVGTGYNDHFYASSGNDHYNGGGGWTINPDGTKVWEANGGLDVLDYSRLSNAIVTFNLAAGTVTKVIGGQTYTDTFTNIEKFVGGANLGDTVFDGSAKNEIMSGGGGNDTYNLGGTPGGSDSIYFTLLNATDANGGNGSDIANGFHVGKIGTDAEADVIDVHELLTAYTGSTGLYLDSDGIKLDAASSKLLEYLKITNDGTNTHIEIDRNGGGDSFTTLLTLNNVQTDLLTLLQNNQIVI